MDKDEQWMVEAFTSFTAQPESEVT